MDDVRTTESGSALELLDKHIQTLEERVQAYRGLVGGILERNRKRYQRKVGSVLTGGVCGVLGIVSLLAGLVLSNSLGYRALVIAALVTAFLVMVTIFSLKIDIEYEDPAKHIEHLVDLEQQLALQERCRDELRQVHGIQPEGGEPGPDEQPSAPAPQGSPPAPA